MVKNREKERKSERETKEGRKEGRKEERKKEGREGRREAVQQYIVDGRYFLRGVHGWAKCMVGYGNDGNTHRPTLPPSLSLLFNFPLPSSFPTAQPCPALPSPAQPCPSLNPLPPTATTSPSLPHNPTYHITSPYSLSSLTHSLTPASQ